MKRYKPFFPHKINFWCRIDVKDGKVIVEERHLFFWWRWTPALSLNAETNEIEKCDCGKSDH